MNTEFAKRNDIGREDMALFGDLPVYMSPATLPISFKLGNRIIRGIPDSFNPKVERKHLDTTMYQTIVTGRNKSGLEIKVEYIQYNDFPMVEWVAYLTNNGKKNTAQISNFRTICEIAYSKAGYQPELSYGSHMFQDLVEADIMYTAIFENSHTKFFNPEVLNGQKDIFPELFPEDEYLHGTMRLYIPENARIMNDYKTGRALLSL